MGDQEGESRRRDENHEQKVAFYKLFSFGDGLDMVLMSVGTLGAIANGFTQPLMTLMMGRAIHSFATSDPSHVVHQVSKVLYKYITSLIVYVFGKLFFILKNKYNKKKQKNIENTRFRKQKQFKKNIKIMFFMFSNIGAKPLHKYLN